MAGKTVKETIHAKGFDIGIYTNDFKNEYISLTYIAFEFASWISAEFKLYIIKNYQRLKTDENSRLSLGWNLNQLLVLANMESYNAVLIDQDKPQSERLVLLRDLAVRQMQTLVSLDSSQIRALPGGEK